MSSKSGYIEPADQYAYPIPVNRGSEFDDDPNDPGNVVDMVGAPGDAEERAAEELTEDADDEPMEEVEEVVYEEAPPSNPVPSRASRPVFSDTEAAVQRITRAPDRGDDMSDLFRVTRQDISGDREDDNNNDLFAVDIERDVLDADKDGTFDSLLTVSSRDIIGEPPPQPRRRRVVSRPRRVIRYSQPPAQMGSLGR